MNVSHRPLRQSLLAGVVMVLLIVAGSVIGTGVQAQAAPGDRICDITVGGKDGSYICKYGVTRITYQSRRHVFVVGTNDAVWHIWQTSVGGGYSNWTSLGGVARSDVTAATATAGGRPVIALLVVGTNNRSYCKAYNAPANPGGWTPGQRTWERC